ncbi:hypothetical protein ABW20_dc0109565 [Dactylellina cionopaga]|nr:hypothetical protein ABW20_dc0109565 [Dactylellina cionopaga]
MFSPSKNYGIEIFALLALFISFFSVVLAAPAPRPLPQNLQSDNSSTKMGNPGWSSHSWCAVNSYKALKQANDRKSATKAPPQPKTKLLTTTKVLSTLTRTATVSAATEDLVGKVVSSETRTPSLNDIPTAFSGARAENANTSIGVTTWIKGLFRRQVPPSNPCHHPNPVFPDEGGPNRVEGCNADPLAPDGSCPHKDRNPDCAYYCEERREYFYGKEERWQPAQEVFPYPDAPLISISKGETLSIGRTMSANMGIDTILLSLGASSAFTTTWSWTNARTFTAPRWDIIFPYCAFFTFLPKMVKSCGTLSKWRNQMIVGPMGAANEICNWDESPETTKDVCAEFPWTNEKGEMEGVLMLGKSPQLTHISES